VLSELNNKNEEMRRISVVLTFVFEPFETQKHTILGLSHFLLQVVWWFLS